MADSPLTRFKHLRAKSGEQPKHELAPDQQTLDLEPWKEMWQTHQTLQTQKTLQATLRAMRSYGTHQTRQTL